MTRARRPHSFLISCGLACLAASPSFAQSSGGEGASKTLGVTPFIAVGDAGAGLAEQVTSKVSSELGSAGFTLRPVALKTPKSRSAKVDFDAGKAELEKALKRSQLGSRYIEKMNFGRATRAFQDAISQFESAAPALVDIKPVFDTWVGLAEVYARRGEDGLQNEALRAAIRLDPERELDASRFPPIFLNAHAEARDLVMEDDKATIIIDTSALGAEVRLDGRVVGVAPLTIRGVVPGRHFIRVFKEGRGLMGSVVEVTAGEEKVLSPGIVQSVGQSATELLSDNRFSAEALDEVLQAAKKAGVDFALIGVVAKTEFSVPTALVAISTASGKAARIGPLEFDGDLLNLSIEVLKIREALDGIDASETMSANAWDEPLLGKVKTAADAEMSEVALRYKYKARPAAAREGPKVVGAGEADSAVGEARRRLMGGKEGSGGRTKSLRDDEDPFAGGEPVVRRSELLEEDVPLTSQPWFWPTAIGGGVAGTLVLIGGTALGLVAAGVLPDPRPNGGLTVKVEVP